MPPESNEARKAPTAFSVDPERDGDVYLVRASGELDLATCNLLSDELKRAEASDAKRILLDLSGLSFIDSSGIAVLVEAHRRSAEDARRLRLFPVSGQVHDMLELTGLMRDFNFVTKP